MPKLNDELRTILYQETRLLDCLIHSLGQMNDTTNRDNKKIRDVILFMIQALGVSIHSILRLTERVDFNIRDCFGIARSASELAVNISYIAASPVNVAERAQQHAMQKTYRNLRRHGTVGGTSFEMSRSDIPTSASIPEMDAALAAFTDSKGREIREWTADNIDKRIEAVSALSRGASLSLSGSVMSIYRHSSELLHGTYFGVLHYWRGSNSEEVTVEGFEKIWLEHFVGIYSAAFLGASGVIEVCAEKFDLPLLWKEQFSLIKRTKALIDKTKTAAP